MEHDLDPADRDRFDRSSSRSVPEAWSASFDRGVVATAHYRASDAGAEMLARGGNAIDAAVAASFALAVCESAGSGIGGMAMMLVHSGATGRTVLIEGACRAPSNATPKEVAAAHRYRGFQAVAVPMHVSVLRHALSRYGTLPEAVVLEPAIRLAEEGFPVTQLQHRNFAQYREALRGRTGARFFLDSEGNPPPVGSRFRQPVLGTTLGRLAEEGLGSFYSGAVAEEIARDSRSHGGFVGQQDLEQALEPTELDPICCHWGDREVRVAGPPAGGLSLVQLLLLDEAWPGIDVETSQGVPRLARAIQRSRTDRQRYRLKIGPRELRDAAPLATRENAREAARDLEAGSGETSHISVLDSDGNGVALTQSIERCFGSAEASPRLGFLYNGYLRGFKVKNKKHPHFLRSGAVARSNAAPTLVLRDGRPEVLIGSTGSERMISGIFGTLLRLRHGSPFDAVHAPRLHCTPDGEILWEADRFPEGCREALVENGFRLSDLESYSFKMGGLQLVCTRDDRLVGVADPRRDGAASGV